MTVHRLLRPLFFLVTASAAFPAAAPTTLVLNPPAGTKPNGKHVVLLSGDEEYRGEEALPMLAKVLSQRHGFKTTVLFALDPDGTINPNNGKSLPGAEALDTADVIIMSLRFRAWPDDAMRHFDAAFKRGVPIIGLRTSTHAFNFPAGSTFSDYTWNSKAPWAGGWGKQVLGETWVSHWGKHKFEATRAVVEAVNASDPLLNGVTEIFGTTDVYEAAPPADAKILFRGLVLKGMKPADVPADQIRKTAAKADQPVNAPAMPIVWTRLYKTESGATAKILATTMGAATDLENESLRRLIVNATYWAAGLKIPAKADVATIDSYAPRPYGFDGYRTGITPADHVLGKVLPVGGNVPPKPPKPTAAAATPAPAASPSPALNSSSAPNIPAAINTPLVLNPGTHIAVIGNSLGDRMQHFGALETLIYAKYPKHELVVRNLAVTGDELVARARSKDFGTPDEWLGKVGADVIFAFFGFNESFAGPDGLAKFKSDLDAFIRETRAKNYGSRGAPHIVLFSPIANETLPDKNFVVPPENNKNLALYAQAMAGVAGDRAGVTFVDLYAPSQKLYADAAKAGQPLTINGVHLNQAGDAAFAPVIFKTLFGEPAPAGDFSKLQTAVTAKNEEWHNRYRTMDGYNVYGDRSKIAYESVKDQPKITNYHVLQEEMAQRDAITANRDRILWAAAKGDTTAPELLSVPMVTPFGTNKPGTNPDGTYEFLSAEDAISKMTLAPGVKVNVFASEKEFPELAKAVQMAWDTKGRLWVSVWPNYPERTPTSKLGDSILILEDTDHDGKADKVTHFLDNLNCPTGFQFYKDGLLVMQAPSLWFVRDTDGDGKADTKERVIMGLDSADSHHTANSLVYEPGGAILLSDGVFHRSQVETALGPVRNLDGALYRFEPRSGKFETYASYGFANPHGRAFDYWGNDIITDATGNNTYFGAAFSGRIDYPEKHPKLKTIWDRPSRPSAGSTIITSTQFPEEYWGNYLNPNVIGFQGIYRVKLVEDGAGIKGIRQTDLISSTDKNFRPIDTSVGPDGAIYVIDWHNPLIGHLQSHLRDANRDHVHGRIYRLTYEGRPLAVPPKIDGQPIPALLELLKRPENQIRNLAKIELGKHDTVEVIAATKTWVAGLDAKNADYQHNLTEALWVHQWHNVVDLDLLTRVLNSPSADARAAATRVVGYWRERVPNVLSILKARAADENPRVRLHAVRAASFFPEAAAADVALAATKLPIEYYLDYVIGETLRQLRPFWAKSLGEGATIADGDPAAVRYLLRTLKVTDLLKMRRTADVHEAILARKGVPDATRAEALAGLSQARKASPVELLLTTIDSPAEVDVKAVGRLLLAQPPADLRGQRPAILKLALADNAEGRSYAWAALALIDGSLAGLWAEAQKSPLSEASFLGGIPLIPDAKLRATAYEIVMPLLAANITDLPGPDNIVMSIQRDAIRSAVSTRRDPAAVFTAIGTMISRGYQVPTAAQGLRAIPRASWPAAPVATAARELVDWAAKAHPSERTGRDYIETVGVAGQLVDALPAAEADPLRTTLAGLRVAVFIVRTVNEEMRYDTPRLVVQAGKSFEIIFENPDGMPHNLVITEGGARQKVGMAAMELPVGNTDRGGRAWVTEDKEIIAATKLLETGQAETLKIGARQEGTYEFLCTFPGHWALMYGQIVVTKDVEAYLKANPSAAPAKPAVTSLELCDPRLVKPLAALSVSPNSIP
ncbi:MAG: HEAT repeat domain-containing protein [Undibacterium sp.]|nr:HEAT repeat domain-containing protein [Opitutaceae bacterium]